jgi:hypothetical protein
MGSQYDTGNPDQQVAQGYSQAFAQQLEIFLGPLLVWLDAAIDVRLVHTFVESIAAIIRFRNRAEGLYLSELGSYILNGEHAPAGSKRLGNLLRCKKWGKELIERYLWTQADHKLTSLEQEGQECLLIWDGSVIEKAESEKTEGLCAVRSSKARRLKRPRKGAYNHAGGKAIVVLGMEWIGMIVVGMQGVPAVATMRWWSRKGAQASTLREQERELLMQVLSRWGRRVINIFDRGYAGGPWLAVLSMWKERFVIRWKKGHIFGNEQGQEKKLWEIARGKRSLGHRQIWDAKSRCYRKMGIVSMRVQHAS